MGEFFTAGALNEYDFKNSNMITENHAELIRLEPHSDATDIDHDFQSPTFRKTIADHINDYLSRNGDYK